MGMQHSIDLIFNDHYGYFLANIFYLQFVSFSDTFKNQSSLKGSTAIDLANRYPEEFIKHTNYQMVRVYPHTLDNVDPQPLWNVGAHAGYCY